MQELQERISILEDNVEEITLSKKIQAQNIHETLWKEHYGKNKPTNNKDRGKRRNPGQKHRKHLLTIS